MPESNHLAAQLRTAIQHSEMTVYQIAKAAGTEPDSIYRFMTEARDIRLETAAKIAEVLGLRFGSTWAIEMLARETDPDVVKSAASFAESVRMFAAKPTPRNCTTALQRIENLLSQLPIRPGELTWFKAARAHIRSHGRKAIDSSTDRLERDANVGEIENYANMLLGMAYHLWKLRP